MMVFRLLLTLGLLLSFSGSASAHALEPGYLELRQLTETSWQVFWRKPDVRGDPMAIDARLPEACSPETGPPPNFDGAAWVAAWVADCDASLAGGQISILGLEAQRTDVLVRMERMNGASFTTRLTPDQIAYTVPEQPTVLSVFTSYFQLGFEHILEGFDHLLFVFALLVLIRDGWRLVGAITAFTVAHSITLALATLGVLRVPAPPVEAIIALSIVFLAVEILKQDDDHARLSERYPWIVSFAFGLLHGLGFAGALSEIGLPQGEIPAALLAFNIGVEAGQLAFVAVVLVIFTIVARLFPKLGDSIRHAGSVPTRVIGMVTGSIATFWLVERIASF